jgi:hypothetical protein
MKSTCETLQQQLNGWPLADPSSHHLFIPMATGSDNFRQTAPSLSVGFLNICMEGNIHSLAFFFSLHQAFSDHTLSLRHDPRPPVRSTVF